MENNIFTQKITNKIINRVDNLMPGTLPSWGKMNVEQMLAHCNVSYEMVYDDIHPVPNTFLKFILKTFVKSTVVSNKPYSQNSKTAPQFIIVDKRNFETEKKRLIEYINKTQKLGAQYFEGKESHSFGKLTKEEWNNLFYKHLDHHLNQFGV